MDEDRGCEDERCDNLLRFQDEVRRAVQTVHEEEEKFRKDGYDHLILSNGAELGNVRPRPGFGTLLQGGLVPVARPMDYAISWAARAVTALRERVPLPACLSRRLAEDCFCGARLFECAAHRVVVTGLCARFSEVVDFGS